MKIVFEKIIPTVEQIEKLYLLLKSRKYSVSHNRLPSIKEHKKFVLKNPYLEWYILSRNENLLGSVYLQSDNSISINLNQPNKNDLLEIIKQIKANHHPLPSIKSFRRGEFFLNVASNNLTLIEILKKLNIKEIQRSFVI
jgi:hypothetical protein